MVNVMKKDILKGENMINLKKIVSTALCICLAGMLAAGCSGNAEGTTKKRIIRVALSQAETHPEYTGAVEFKNYIESELGDKYEVQIFQMSFLDHRRKQLS